MTITEPMTMATDFVLAAQGFIYARWLSRRSRLLGVLSMRHWARGFFAMAVGALAGGIAHGFSVPLGVAGQTAVWKITVWAVGVASFLLLASALTAAVKRPVRRWLVPLAGLKLAVYTVWMGMHDDFLFVILDYGGSLLVVAGLALWSWSHGGSEARWILAGIGVSFGAAAVQQSGFALHPHLNADVIYHVIQMGGLYLLYRGGRLLVDADASPAANLSARPA